jgi:hypothetical protein
LADLGANFAFERVYFGFCGCLGGPSGALALIRGLTGWAGLRAAQNPTQPGPSRGLGGFQHVKTRCLRYNGGDRLRYQAEDEDKAEDELDYLQTPQARVCKKAIVISDDETDELADTTAQAEARRPPPKISDLLKYSSATEKDSEDSLVSRHSLVISRDHSFHISRRGSLLEPLDIQLPTFASVLVPILLLLVYLS